jgi:hypothetical protein
VIFDTFPFAGTDVELLLLECRLSTLYDVVDHFVIVEATTDHQGHAKPLHFLNNRERYDQWKDKLCYIVADDLPSVAEDDWSWAREHAQREHIADGLVELDAQADDIVMQSDADEIPHPLIVRNLRLQGRQLVSFEQKGHFWAVDWLYPYPWYGTTATRVANLGWLGSGEAGPFTMMRNHRNMATVKLPNGGCHFSWLGRAAAARQKVGSFCHPEVVTQMPDDLDWYWREGYHVGGGDNGQPVKMQPVEVDSSYPKWMQDPANVPDDWRRPR